MNDKSLEVLLFCSAYKTLHVTFLFAPLLQLRNTLFEPNLLKFFGKSESDFEEYITSLFHDWYLSRINYCVRYIMDGNEYQVYMKTYTKVIGFI